MPESAPQSRAGLFHGTAAFYARYRGSYPSAFIELLARSCHLDRKQRLLDLGCGPGLLAIPFAKWAGEVIGLDPEPEMLDAAAKAAKAAGVFNLRWVLGDSGDLGPHLGLFRLVVIGRAFHWMDRAATLKALHQLIVPGGAVAIIEEKEETDPKSWRAIIRGLSDRRGDRRSPQAREPSHAQVVAESAFRGPEHLQWPVTRSWTIEEILGYVRSTSMGALRAAAGETESFEAAARAELLEAEPSGRFVEQARIGVLLGWRD